MILLDTSIVLGLAWGDPIRPSARAQIAAAISEARLFVSAVTAWELGLLATRSGQTGPRIGNATQFFDLVVARAKLVVLPVSATAALDAAYLPEPFHRDPSDRMIVAIARGENLTIATNDRKILTYAALGHVRAIAC